MPKRKQSLNDDVDNSSDSSVNIKNDELSGSDVDILPIVQNKNNDDEDGDFMDASVPFNQRRVYTVGIPRKIYDDYNGDFLFQENPQNNVKPIIRPGTWFLDNNYTDFDSYVNANPDGFRPGTTIAIATPRNVNGQRKMTLISERTISSINPNQLNDGENGKYQQFNGQYQSTANSSKMMELAGKSAAQVAEIYKEQNNQLAQRNAFLEQQLAVKADLILDLNMKLLAAESKLDRKAFELKQTDKENAALSDNVKKYKNDYEEKAKALNDGNMASEIIGFARSLIGVIPETIKSLKAPATGISDGAMDIQKYMLPEEIAAIQLRKQESDAKIAAMNQANAAAQAGTGSGVQAPGFDINRGDLG